MATKSGTWRIWLSDLLIATGGLILLVGALFWTRTALAAGQIEEYRYLPSPLRPSLPLPALYLEGQDVRLSLSPVPVSPEIPAAGLPETPAAAASAEAAPVVTEAVPATAVPPAASPTPAATHTPTALAAAPTQAAPVSSPPAQVPGDASALALPTGIAPTAVPPTETPSPSPTPTPAPTEGIPPYSAVVRLVVPSLDIDRAVVPVGLRPTSGGSLDWDTDPLFATQNRPDLVGQLVGSYSPGQGGNILLIGHNYNQVDWGWTGVFVNIKTLQVGDQIAVFTEDGRKTLYQVVQVKQVPWRSKNANEMEKHMKFMGDSDGEQLTLITCGGANIWPFPARVYVVAKPVAQ